jgi:hypothetical protein
MELTRIPPEIAENTSIRGMRVETNFIEVVPGLSIISLMESSATTRASANLRSERGAVIDVKWQKGPP